MVATRKTKRNEFYSRNTGNDPEKQSTPKASHSCGSARRSKEIRQILGNVVDLEQEEEQDGGSHLLDVSEPIIKLPKVPKQFSCSVIGKTPVVKALGRNFKLSESFIIFVKIIELSQSIGFRRIRFWDSLAGLLNNQIELNDRINVWGTNINLDEGFDTTKKDAYDISATTKVSDMCPYTHWVNSRYLSIPGQWVLYVCQQCNNYIIEYPSIPSIRILNPYHQLLNQLHAVTETESPERTSPTHLTRYSYSPLSSLSCNYNNYCFGVIVDISRSTKQIRLPKMGSVFTLNIDVVDPSLVHDFTSAMNSLNPARVGIQLIAPTPDLIPLISLGDIIRIHRVVFRVVPNPRSVDDFFLDGCVSPWVSIRIWDSTQLRNESSDFIPVWKSKHPIIQIPGSVTQWDEEKEHPLNSIEKDILTYCGNWVNQTLISSPCLHNSYLTDLANWIYSELPFRDIIVKIIDIEEGASRFCERRQNDVLYTQDSQYSTQQHVYNVGDTKLRLRVIDQSCIGPDDIDNSQHPFHDLIWIATNFQPLAVPQLRNLRINEFIRIRNAEYKGPQPLIGDTRFLPIGMHQAEYLLIDCYRARILRIPDIYIETHYSKLYNQ